MAKIFDKQVLITTIMGVVQKTFKMMMHADFTAEPEVVERDIIEYDGRMRVFPMDKFNAPAFAAIINYYFSEKDMKDKFAVGTFVFFIKEEMIEKLFIAFNRSVSDVENDAVCLDVVGELTNILAGNVKNELREMGYLDLYIPAPRIYKNVVSEGAQFDYNLFKKQEIIFSFWKEKCLAVEACMGHVPQENKGPKGHGHRHGS